MNDSVQNSNVGGANPNTNTYYVSGPSSMFTTGSSLVVGSWTTTLTNPNKAKLISIEEVDNGYIVTVGCQKFAIGSSKKLVKLLTQYLEDPAEIERQWFANEFTLKRVKVKKEVENDK